ncbi:unnamed protein product [Caenorhabditis sp. 36 PRJEB53466]|nr:unnamed protein product [Caenorhabditis sp. 36 PRJEB53466]
MVALLLAVVGTVGLFVSWFFGFLHFSDRFMMPKKMTPKKLIKGTIAELVSFVLMYLTFCWGVKMQSNMDYQSVFLLPDSPFFDELEFVVGLVADHKAAAFLCFLGALTFIFLYAKCFKRFAHAWFIPKQATIDSHMITLINLFITIVMHHYAGVWLIRLGDLFNYLPIVLLIAVHLSYICHIRFVHFYKMTSNPQTFPKHVRVSPIAIWIFVLIATAIHIAILYPAAGSDDAQYILFNCSVAYELVLQLITGLVLGPLLTTIKVCLNTPLVSGQRDDSYAESILELSVVSVQNLSSATVPGAAQRPSPIELNTLNLMDVI